MSYQNAIDNRLDCLEQTSMDSTHIPNSFDTMFVQVQTVKALQNIGKQLEWIEQTLRDRV